MQRPAALQFKTSANLASSKGGLGSQQECEQQTKSLYHPYEKWVFISDGKVVGPLHLSLLLHKHADSEHANFRFYVTLCIEHSGPKRVN